MDSADKVFCLEIQRKDRGHLSSGIFFPTESFHEEGIIPKPGVLSVVNKEDDQVITKSAEEVLILLPEADDNNKIHNIAPLRVAAHSREFIFETFSTGIVLQVSQVYRQEIARLMGIEDPVFIEIPACQLNIVEYPRDQLEIFFNELSGKEEYFNLRQAFQIEWQDESIQFISEKQEDNMWYRGQLVNRKAGSFTPLLEDVLFCPIAEGQVLIASNYSAPITKLLGNRCLPFPDEAYFEDYVPRGFKILCIKDVKVKNGYLSAETHRRYNNMFLKESA